MPSSSWFSTGASGFRARVRRPAQSLLLLLAGLAGAQMTPQGPQFQVNTITTGGQSQPALAVDGEGRTWVVWGSAHSAGNDQGSGSIQMRRFDRRGLALEVQEFQVNSYTTGGQGAPAIAAVDGGGFVVAWESLGSAGTDQDGRSLQARLFGPDAAPLGPDFQINSTTAGYQWKVAVAAEPGGGFLAAWQDGAWGAPELSVRARRFDALGAPLGADFAISAQGAHMPAAAADGQGRRIVTWDEDFLGIYARRFGPDGQPLGEPFPVETAYWAFSGMPRVSADAAGGFVIVWNDYFATYYNAVYAQRFAADGSRLGTNQLVASSQYVPTYPDVANHESQGFMVVWEDGRDLVARGFRKEGWALGATMVVNTEPCDATTCPSGARAVADAAGDFFVVWDSQDSPGDDQSSWSIQARRFDALFRDGVESGDTGRWSVTFPAGGR